MQFCVLIQVCVCEKEQIRRDAKGKHLAFTYVTKNNGQEAIFIGADEWVFCTYFSYAADKRTLHSC